MSQQLDSLRKQIDTLDEKILIAIAERISIVKKIGQYKNKQGIFAFDKKRWKQLLKSNLEKGEKLGLPKKFIKNLFHLIHEYSLEIQKKYEHG